jgi:hypothetical protein
MGDDAVSDDAVRDDAVRDDAIICATCGHALIGDPDEDPTGDAGMAICGECSRERDFFAMDVADGTLDGEIDA